MKKDYNLGIAILRVLLSFMVVFDHLYNFRKKLKYIHILYFHIPTFFVVSFYFTYNTLISFNIEKIKLRFERLLIPYFFWNFFSWLLFNVYFYILKKKVRHSLRDLIINFINGHIFDIVLWFQNNLIFITLIFFIVIFLFKNNYMFFLYILCIISYFLNYSGINYYFFKNNFTYESYITFGRYAETLPLSFTGFYLASLKIIDRIKICKKKAYFISFTIILLINKYNVFKEIRSFKYSGLRLNISAICIFIIFSLFPSEKIKNLFIKKLIIRITGYSGGIYFIHYLIGKGYLMKKIIFVKNHTFLGCVIVYFTSYIVSFFGFKIFRKTNFKHLFA